MGSKMYRMDYIFFIAVFFLYFMQHPVPAMARNLFIGTRCKKDSEGEKRAKKG